MKDFETYKPAKELPYTADLMPEVEPEKVSPIQKIKDTFAYFDSWEYEELKWVKIALIGAIIFELLVLFGWLGWRKFAIVLMIPTLVFLVMFLFLERRKQPDDEYPSDQPERKPKKKVTRKPTISPIFDKKPIKRPKKKAGKGENQPSMFSGFPNSEEFQDRLQRAVGSNVQSKDDEEHEEKNRDPYDFGF